MTVPTTAEVKHAYATGDYNYGENCLNFDKWLAAIQRAEWRKGYAEGYADGNDVY